jgi:chromosome segregation ATPase
VNAENVAKAVKRSAQNAQFIQISLRKVSLKEADHIMGVTMQREGISELIFKPNIGEEDIATGTEESAGAEQGAS